jgi:hypothetical protein
MVYLPIIHKIYRRRELLWKLKEIVGPARIREVSVGTFTGLILEEEFVWKPVLFSIEHQLQSCQ